MLCCPYRNPLSRHCTQSSVGLALVVYVFGTLEETAQPELCTASSFAQLLSSPDSKSDFQLTQTSEWQMQGEQYSPFRALVNMVPEQGVPKYDFLRNMLQGAVDSPADSGPAGTLSQPICPSYVILCSHCLSSLLM